MKKIVKNILVFCLTFCTVILASGIVCAAETDTLQLPNCPAGETIRIPVGDAEYIEDAQGNRIAIDALPTFGTQQQADAYIRQIITQLNDTDFYEPAIIDFRTRASNGDSVVAQENAGFGTISLHVTYTTSGNNFTGKVTNCGAYTSFSGFTMGFGWDERTCYAEIRSSGKDVYGYAAGDLTYNLFVDGFIELGREAITLSGTAYAAH